MEKKSLGATLRSESGPLGIFIKYPVLLRLAAISMCAEIAWATLLIVLQYHFKDDLLVGFTPQLIAARVAWVTFAFVACETLLKYPMGWLSDRFGSRPMIFFALGVATISPLAMTQASQWWHFIPLRALDGVAAAALWPAMSSLMARSVPREAKSAALSAFNGAYLAGLAIGPLIGLVLGHQFGNAAVFPLCSIVMVLGMGLAFSVLKGDVGSRAEGDHETGIALREKPLLKRMLILYGLSQAAVGLIAPMMVLYIAHQFDIQEENLPGLLVIPALFISVLALPIGHTADKIGRAKTVHLSYVLATAGMLLVAATSLMEPTSKMISSPIAVFSTGLLLLVASYILGTPAWLGLASTQVDEAHQAKAMSLMQTAQGFGLVVGTAVVMSSAALLVKTERFRHAIRDRKGFHISERGLEFLETDSVPISVWLWASALVFLLCLIGTLIWIHEPIKSPMSGTVDELQPASDEAV